MIIKDNRNIAQFIMILNIVGFIFLSSLCYFLGSDITIQSFCFYILAIFMSFLIPFFWYFLFNRLNKKYYKVLDNKIVLYKDEEILKEFEYDKMKNICYIKVYYLLFMQIFAGNLKFSYENKTEGICMSYKQALQFQKISKLMIYLYK